MRRETDSVRSSKHGRSRNKENKLTGGRDSNGELHSGIFAGIPVFRSPFPRNFSLQRRTEFLPVRGDPSPESNDIFTRMTLTFPVMN